MKVLLVPVVGKTGMKRTALELAILLALLFSLVGVPLVNLANANPYWPPPFYPETPNKDPPLLTVQSPVNNTNYLTEVPLNFTVTKRESWYQNNLTVVSIQSVTYELDGNPPNILWSALYNRPSTLPPTKDFSRILNVSDGEHNLKINIIALSFYDPKQSVDWHFVSSARLVTTQTISFTVNVDTIPEFPSWIMLPIFVTATLFALIIKRRLLHPS